MRERFYTKIDGIPVRVKRLTKVNSQESIVRVIGAYDKEKALNLFGTDYSVANTSLEEVVTQVFSIGDKVRSKMDFKKAEFIVTGFEPENNRAVCCPIDSFDRVRYAYKPKEIEKILPMVTPMVTLEVGKRYKINGFHEILVCSIKTEDSFFIACIYPETGECAVSIKLESEQKKITIPEIIFKDVGLKTIEAIK